MGGGGGGVQTHPNSLKIMQVLNIYIKGNKRFRKVSINKYTYT